MQVRNISEDPRKKGWKGAARQMLMRAKQYGLWLYLTGQASMMAGLSSIGIGAYLHNAWGLTAGVVLGMHGFNRARRHMLYRIDRLRPPGGNGSGPQLVR